MQLEPTGERMIEEFYIDSPQNYLIYLFHIATYKFVLEQVTGMRVLDYGCGSGYGTHYVAASCKSIVGVDIADDAIGYAKSHYKADNLAYQHIARADQAPLPFQDEEFDVVISFQVIEHISDIDPYLSEIRRVLKPGGVFVCATPDRSSRLLQLQKPWNMWYIHEYDAKGFEQALISYFSSVEVLCMGGTKSVLDIEIKRTKRLMWLTLPVTMPFIPEVIRISSLKLLKKLAGLGKKKDQKASKVFHFGEKDLVIAPKLSPSVNLIAIARKL
jgi:ubiquinone/menaquinone biosynthesis C-methylase UbiE